MTNRKALTLLGSALLLAACSDAATSPEAMLAPATKPATNNGPVWVTGTALFTTTLNTVTGVGINRHPQAGRAPGGTCRNADGQIAPAEGGAEYSIWYNQNGEQNTGAKFCEGIVATVETTIICPVKVPATWAVGSNIIGNNELLNFTSELVTLDPNVVIPDMFVHYLKTPNATRARGQVPFTATCSDDKTRTGMLDIAEYASDLGSPFAMNATNNGRKLVPQAGISTSDGLVGTLELSWIYRSRVKG